MTKELAAKYTGQPCQVYTLQGIKAGIISEGREGNASIKTLDGSISMAVNWGTVERKMESDKLFYSC